MKFGIQIDSGRKASEVQQLLHAQGIRVESSFHTWVKIQFLSEPQNPLMGIGLRKLDFFLLCDAPDTTNLRALKEACIALEYRPVTTEAQGQAKVHLTRVTDIDLIRQTPLLLKAARIPENDHSPRTLYNLGEYTNADGIDLAQMDAMKIETHARREDVEERLIRSHLESYSIGRKERI